MTHVSSVINLWLQKLIVANNIHEGSINLAKETAKAKFDESIDIAINLELLENLTS